MSMESITESNTLPIREGAEVIVAGGGIAGIAAALAARRQGASVLLLEKSILYGGLATNGLINWYEPLCNGQGEQLIFGLAEELLRLSIRYGDDTLPQIWREPGGPSDIALVRPEKQHRVGGRYGTFFSPTLFQLAIDERLQAEGVQLRLDILAAKPVMEGERCAGVICESKSGREFYPARVVIDATGDADLFFRANAPCIEGRNYLSCIAQTCSLTAKSRALQQRRWMACGADLHGQGHPAGYPNISGVDNAEETRFILDGRGMLLEKLRGDDRHARDVTALPSLPQLRETRRIDGAFTLREDDRCQRREDSIGLASDFERVGDWYEIPWGCLYTDAASNLLAAGRMISSDGWAWDVTRVIPVCALTGQAAGVAAALMARGAHGACDARAMDLPALQAAIAAQGVRLHYES